MPLKPRLRIFAGPNGSGKTTLYHNIKENYISTRLFINADLLEQEFKQFNYIDFATYDINSTDETFQSFSKNQGQYFKAGFTDESWNLTVTENVLVAANISKQHFNSMHFAIVADFIRQELIRKKISFSFETVFSHPSKLQLIDLAHQNGYKVYLYFVGTDSPEINEERVKDRVKKGGHSVKKEYIYDRYQRTMELLLQIIKSCDVVYLWDNSQKKQAFVAELKGDYFNFTTEYLPLWISKYIIDKLEG